MTVEQSKDIILRHSMLFSSMPDDVLEALHTLLELEPCDDAISRILKRMWNCRGKHTTSIDKVKMEQIIRDELSVNPQEPKTGHWSHDGSHWKNRFICSGCGYKLFDEPTNYCPNCGCRMVEPQESEE